VEREPHIPRSSYVLTFALRSINGVGRRTPFLMIRMTPFFLPDEYATIWSPVEADEIVGLQLSHYLSAELGIR